MSESVYSLEFLNEKIVIKHCDKSFFDSNGMAIPKECKSFFGIENLHNGERRDVIIFYSDGKKYNAHFIVDDLNRARFYWEKALSDKLIAFKDMSGSPVAWFEKSTDTFYYLNMRVGSEADALVNHPNEWIVPCNPQKYDCFKAFNDLIKIDWHQSKQLKNIEIDDIVYIYSAAPLSAITHKCIVNKVNVAELEIPDNSYYKDRDFAVIGGPYFELQCFLEYDALEGLKLESLKKNGVKGNIQGPVRVTDDLSKYLDEMTKLQNEADRFGSPQSKFISALLTRKSAKDEALDVKTAAQLSDEALRQIAISKKETQVKTVKVTTEQRQRNPYIAEYAKRRANGICQLCGNRAPFSDESGKPYLESHHIEWLSNGGEDSIENTVALCPNCHRKMHIVKDASDIAILKKKASI